MRIELDRLNSWSVADRYRMASESGSINLGERKIGRPEERMEPQRSLVIRVAHQQEGERPQESQNYNREGQRVPYVPPGQVFEAQG